MSSRHFKVCGNAPNDQGLKRFTHTQIVLADLEGFMTARVRLLLPQSSWLLVDCCELVPLEHQRLLKLLLCLCLQELLPEGDVGKEGSERPAQFHRRLGTFLWGKKMQVIQHLNNESVIIFRAHLRSIITSETAIAVLC